MRGCATSACLPPVLENFVGPEAVGTNTLVKGGALLGNLVLCLHGTWHSLLTLVFT